MSGTLTPERPHAALIRELRAGPSVTQESDHRHNETLCIVLWPADPRAWCNGCQRAAAASALEASEAERTEARERVRLHMEEVVLARRERDQRHALQLEAEAERARLVEGLIRVLDSARPNQRDHPTMTAAWADASRLVVELAPDLDEGDFVGGCYVRSIRAEIATLKAGTA